jgi:hypothetical protein
MSSTIHLQPLSVSAGDRWCAWVTCPVTGSDVTRRKDSLLFLRIALYTVGRSTTQSLFILGLFIRICTCESVSVLDRASFSQERKLREAIQIRINNPKINRDCGVDLPTVYDAILKKRSEFSRRVTSLPVTGQVTQAHHLSPAETLRGWRWMVDDMRKRSPKPNFEVSWRQVRIKPTKKLFMG